MKFISLGACALLCLSSTQVFAAGSATTTASLSLQLTSLNGGATYVTFSPAYTSRAEADIVSNTFAFTQQLGHGTAAFASTAASNFLSMNAEATAVVLGNLNANSAVFSTTASIVGTAFQASGTASLDPAYFTLSPKTKITVTEIVAGTWDATTLGADVFTTAYLNIEPEYTGFGAVNFFDGYEGNNPSSTLSSANGFVVKTLTFSFENTTNVPAVEYLEAGINAEVIDFTAAPPIPEPTNVALMLADLGLIGATACRHSPK